jgi:hypothetical protein
LFDQASQGVQRRLRIFLFEIKIYIGYSIILCRCFTQEIVDYKGAMAIALVARNSGRAVIAYLKNDLPAPAVTIAIPVNSRLQKMLKSVKHTNAIAPE